MHSEYKTVDIEKPKPINIPINGIDNSIGISLCLIEKNKRIVAKKREAEDNMFGKMLLLKNEKTTEDNNRPILFNKRAKAVIGSASSP